MVKSIIFDCFGVLTSDGWLPFKQKYFASDSDRYSEATAQNALANARKISYQEFLRTVSALAAVSEQELDAAMHSTQKNEAMLDLVRSLSAHYKIGLLSNISGDWLSELFEADEIALFSATALSYETGYAKPHMQAYRIIANRLGCAESECVFIDDQPSFVEAAEKSGMHAILFRGSEQLKLELQKLLHVADSDK